MKIILTALAFLFCIAQNTAQDYKFGKVSIEELSQKEHPKEPEANAAILNRDIKSEILYDQNDGFYLMTDIVERIKIYKKEGFDWATKKISLYQGSGGSDEKFLGLKAYTYYLGPDGNIAEVKLRNDGIFEEKTSKYRETTTFTMPDLKEGCIVEFKYSIESPFISNIDEFRFQEEIPVDHVDFRFKAPEYYKFKTHQKGWQPLNLKNETENGKLSTGRSFIQNIMYVKLHNVPALKEEAYSGNVNNYATALKLELSYRDFPNTTIDYYSTTWDDVSKTIYKSSSFGGELSKTEYFKDDIDALIKDAKGNDEKIQLIFEYVKNKITWNEYFGIFSDNGTRSAYKDLKGSAADINLMLVAMLRYAGLKANPILLSTKSNGIPLFPTRNGFNFVIAGVEVNNDVILMDATHKRNEVDILETGVMNWQGRIIRENGTSAWVPLQAKKQAVQSSLINATLSDDLSITGISKTRYTGHYAMDYRTNYADVKADDARKKMEEKTGEVELSNLTFENLKELYKPVAVEYEFESFDAVEEIGGKIYISPMLFLKEKENPFKLEERKYPVDFGYSKKDRYIINITIPEGYTVESMPESTAFALGENMGSFKYRLSNTANKVQVSVELALNQPIIAAADYANLKKFFQLLIDKENEKVVLSKA